jgi:3D (Asp-Asp-Asp) domain-containing protein
MDIKQTIPITSAVVLVFLWMGSVIDVPTPSASGSWSKTMPIDRHAESVGRQSSGVVREVTAYNVGVKEQTNDEPCIGATGRNLCRLVARGRKICAANFVDPDTILQIEGYGECIVLDRMNRRFARRVDIAMGKDEVHRALEFGIQRRHVAVKSGPP